MNRRRFLSSGAVAVCMSGSYWTGRVCAQDSADIGVMTGTDIEATVRAAVASVGGIEKFVQRGDNVAIKPNLSFASPIERAVTTNPAVVVSVIKLCQEAGAGRIMVLDHPLQDAAVIGTNSELAGMVRDMKGVSFFLPSTENLYREIPIPQGKVMKSTQTMTILDDMDVLINVPIAKNHSATAVSLGIKGNLGLVWDRVAYHNSSDFNQSLADLATILKADLTIVDAVRALLTRGPQGPGRVQEFNTIIAGTDPVAVDSYAVSFVWKQWDLTGRNVEHLVKSEVLGLGSIDTTTLNVVTETL
ncbi:DUF362 domain-containing protein [Candidatus Latescibacterota bacterium]